MSDGSKDQHLGEDPVLGLATPAMAPVGVAPRSRPRMGRFGNSAFLVIGQSTQALGFGAISLFLPLIRHDVGLSFTQGGTLAAVTTLTYAIMLVPAGFLGDRFNAKTMFVIGLIGVNITSLVFALSTDYGVLVGSQAVGGIFRAFLFGPGMVLIQAQFTPERRATAMGLFVAGGLSSNVLLNLLAPLLVAPLGWRTLLVLFSVFALGVAVLYQFLGTAVVREAGTEPPKLRDIPRLFTYPVVWTTGVIQFVRLSVALGFVFWLPTILIGDKGFSLAETGLVVALTSLVAAPANLLGGAIADRLGRPLLVIGTALVVVGITVLLLNVVHSAPLVILVVGVNALVLNIYFGPLFAVPLKYVGAGRAGLLTSTGNFMASLGGFVTSLVMGAIRDATGRFDIALDLLAALCAVAVLATIATGRLRAPAPPAATASSVSAVGAGDDGIAL